jgi:hypothetical protein
VRGLEDRFPFLISTLQKWSQEGAGTRSPKFVPISMHSLELKGINVIKSRAEENPMLTRSICRNFLSAGKACRAFFAARDVTLVCANRR